MGLGSGQSCGCSDPRGSGIPRAPEMSSTFPKLLEPQLPETSTAPLPCSLIIQPGYSRTGHSWQAALPKQTCVVFPAHQCPPGDTSHLPKHEGGGVPAFLHQPGDPGCVLASSHGCAPAPRPGSRGTCVRLQVTATTRGKGQESLMLPPGGATDHCKVKGQEVTNDLPFWAAVGAGVGKLGLRRATQNTVSYMGSPCDLCHKDLTLSLCLESSHRQKIKASFIKPGRLQSAESGN